MALQLTARRLVTAILAGSVMLLVTATATATGAGKLYKWVDESGKVHYGDKVPPEAARRERKVLSDQGVVVQTLDRAKTEEEYAREAAEARALAEEQRRRAAVRAHDHMLLATFSSEEDLLMTRDGKLASIDAGIRITRDRIARADRQIEELTRAAADIERSAQAVPEKLQRNIESLRSQVHHYRAYIAAQEQEKTKLRERFDADLERFRYLQSRRQPNPPGR